MSTRTSIRFGAILDSLVRERLRDYQQCFSETTNQSLLYGFRKPVYGHYNAFILIQAARSFGRLTCEVAISRDAEYPYFRLSDQPRLGVAGFRERLRTVLDGRDKVEVYRTTEHLISVLLELSHKAEVALSQLADRAIPVIVEEHRIWQPLYRDWLEAEKRAVRSEEQRYPGLEGETVAREVLHDTLARGTFDRFLGPLKFRYRQDGFFHCHLYLLARALEFLEPPALPEVLDTDAEEAPEEIPPLPDPIASLTGRQCQKDAVELAVSTSVRTMQYAFLKSFAAVEAFYTDEPADQAIVELPDHKNPEEMSLDELYQGILDSPAYASPTVTISAPAPPAPTPEPEPAPEPPSPPQAKTAPGRPDPFEHFAEFLREDPFESLGLELEL